MRTDELQDGAFCLYPPRLADVIDVTPQTEGEVTRYVVRNTATSRYFLLKSVEHQIFRQFDGTQTISEIARGGRQAAGPRVTPQALIKFLAKLDSLGLIARGGDGVGIQSKKQERGLYTRFPLFNPNRLLAWLDQKMGWALTRPFITASFALMAAVVFGLASRADEVAAYTSYTYSEYGLAAILLTTLAITAMHEVAHGLACKHFGGDVREIGVLMIFYVIPAFYCNVSDIHRFGRRSERLWVIFAGIYFQMVVSAAGALVWLVAQPQTMIADLAFLILTGGTFNIIVNCNPLIKLDGYYALSQWLGVQNLQTRSADYARRLGRRVLDGEQPQTGEGRHSVLYLSYWLCSLAYTAVLIWIILGFAGEWLMNGFGIAGVFLTLGLAGLLTEKWWRPLLKGVLKMSSQQTEENRVTARGQQKGWTVSRRQVIKGLIVLLIIAALVAPWEASTGSDCALVLPPGREGVVRANTDAVMTEVFVQPGDVIAEGSKIARLGNPEIEDRLTQLNAEIERLATGASRLEEELRVRSEMLLSASFKETDRKRVASELKQEATRITEWDREREGKQDSAGSKLPASLAVLQSEIELKQAELEHNRREVERYKKLFEQGLVGEQLYDRAVAAMRVSEKEIQGARARLEAALVEHRRTTSGAETVSLVAETDSRAARSSFEALIAELHANRQQLESSRQRRDILQREYDGMNLLAPRAGVVLGEDLRRSVGRRFGRGEEICRIGELEKFLLKIEVNEREIANVRLDSPVRFKLKTVPGRTFTGQVSKINAEPAPNQYGQRFYPVEVVVENSDGLLRPGMTGFARISFGRQSIGVILAEKLWNALRPELWLF
jgi:putative peptide zinc metalloprotease protein